MLGSRRLVAFLATTDADRALGFYRDTLGLELVSNTEWALVFHAGGTVVRIQKVQLLLHGKLVDPYALAEAAAAARVARCTLRSGAPAPGATRSS